MPELKCSPAALGCLLYYCDEHYRELHPNAHDVGRDEVLAALALAKKNKLAYAFATGVISSGLSLPALVEVAEFGRSNLQFQRDTMEFVSTVVHSLGVDYLVIKSFKGLSYITLDVDIMVPGDAFDGLVRAFLEHGATMNVRTDLPKFLERRLARPGGASFIKKGLLEIDVYQDTTWTGWVCLDNDFLWQQPVTEQIAGWPCLTPNKEADLLLNLAHCLFNHGDLNLLDFIYVQSLLRQGASMEKLRQETGRYGWDGAMQATLALMSKREQVLHTTPKNLGDKCFPWALPMGTILSSYTQVARASKVNASTAWSHWLNTALHLAIMVAYRVKNIPRM